LNNLGAAFGPVFRRFYGQLSADSALHSAIVECFKVFPINWKKSMVMANFDDANASSETYCPRSGACE
jgi:hypothetical protein